MSGRPSLRVRLLLFGAVPFVLLGGMAAMYYSDVPALRRIVSPERLAVPADVQSEFGLLETLQAVGLAALAGVAAAGLARRQHLGDRLVFWALLFAAVLLLLEETDYGMHYAELLGDGTTRAGEPAGHHNIHRIGYLGVVLRSTAQFAVLLALGAFAILFGRSRHPFLRRIAPDRMIVLGVLLVTAVQEVVWKLAVRFPADHGTLAGNEIEFTELGVVWLLLVHAIDLVAWRRPAPAAPGTPAAP